MRQEFVNPFLSAAQHVFEVELEHEFKFAVAQVTEDTITSENITASIGVSGRLEGNVFYGFKRRVARAILTIMLGKPSSEMDQMALSALGEPANMITGNAAISLVRAGYSTDLMPPTLGCPQIVGDLTVNASVPRLHQLSRERSATRRTKAESFSSCSYNNFQEQLTVIRGPRVPLSPGPDGVSAPGRLASMAGWRYPPPAASRSGRFGAICTRRPGPGNQDSQRGIHGRLVGYNGPELPFALAGNA